MIDCLAVLHSHVAHQLLHPLLPGVDPVTVQDGTRVQQGHSGIAVQVLQASAQYGPALLQKSTHLRLQSFTLADQVSLTCVLQKCCSRDVAGRTCNQENGL